MNRYFDRFAGVLFFAVGMLVFIEARGISDSAYGSSIGPKTFPMGLGIVLIILSGLLIFESFYKMRTSKNDGEGESKSPANYKSFAIIFLAALGYIFLLERLGYIITTFAFLLVSFRALDKGSWIAPIVIAAAFSGIIYYGFVEVLGGSLPRFPF